jgi:tape measure domain-containing protein
MAIGKLLLKLGIDTTNLDKELGKVEKSMTRFGQNMSNLGSTLTQSLTLPIIGVGAAALKSFADMEKLQNGLIAIMGSSEGAAIELEKLRKVAENPGLALPEVVKASATLQSVGMSADVARETITQFGNAVARAGMGAETFDGVIVALGQISAVGKVTQEDLNQIKGRLPEFAEVMKNEFGVVTAEALNKLGISSEDFITRSVSALGELERAKGGLGNAFDNLKDNITNSLAELGKVINTSLNVEAIFTALSDKINYLVEGFKSLNPQTQAFIVKAALIVAAIGPAIFIVGKLITTFGAMVGTFKLIKSTVVDLAKAMNKAFLSILANPAILGITLAIVAIGAVALYVYDNWEAFASRFQNIWINIKNSTMKGVADFMKNIDKLQKFLGIELFDVSGLTNYTEQQKVVQKEFKSIGETVDSLSGKLKSLFVAAPKSGGKTGGIVSEDIIEPTTTTTGGGGGGSTSPVAAIAAQSTGITNMLPTLDLLAIKLDTASASNQRLKETNEEVKNSFVATEAQMMSFGNTMTSAFIAATDAFSNMAMQGETDLKKLGSAALQAARQSITANIKIGISGLVKNILDGPTGKALGPFALAVAGAAGAGASVLFNTLLNKVAPPALAQGGLAYGPTMATVGDNRNARVDPEVIAPLSKLKGMLDGGGSPYILTTRVAGSDLLVIMEKARNINSRIR